MKADERSLSRSPRDVKQLRVRSTIPVWRALTEDIRFVADGQKPRSVQGAYHLTLTPRAGGPVLSIYRQHDHRDGRWPNHFSVQELYERRALEQFPEYVANGKSSYGWIVPRGYALVQCDAIDRCNQMV